MKTARSLHIIVLILIAGLIGYYVGISKISLAWKNYKPQITIANKEPPPRLQNIDFSTFWTVWQKLEDSYYDKQALDGQKLLNGAISGMVEGLDDPYTVFLPPKQNDSFKEGLAGQFQGIGAELGMKEKQIVVVAPLDGSPAKKAGIKAGDAILKVNKDATFGWTLAQAVEKIRGPKGTEVVLSILHKSAETPTDIKITRDTINIKSVEGWVKPIREIDTVRSSKFKVQSDRIAYIRLSQFGDQTNKEWLTIVNDLDLQIKADKNVKGLILDLRNNPGGYLTEAAFIASEFIKSGVVVKQEKGNGETTPFNVTRKGLLTEIPIIVLINKGSASASEIVAGALRDYKRAKLVGETSFGKGTIQQAEELGNGAGLHVTIAKWLTPNGTWVHKKGLTPDIAIETNGEKDPSVDVQLEKAVGELVK